MPQVFPLTGFPQNFIPTALETFIEIIIDDILEEVLYPHERESDPSNSFPTVLNLNTFVQPLNPEAAMDMVDEFCSKKYKKLRLQVAAENYGLRKIYREFSDLKPTCFLVLGDPSERRYEAAKIFAKMTRRVHLDVLDLVNSEMSKESQCGKWIYTNLCEGRCIPTSVVLNLVRMATRQDDVQNAGYILTGFPLIPCQMLCMDHLPQPLNKMRILKSPPAEEIQNWRRVVGMTQEVFMQPANVDTPEGELSEMNLPESRELLTTTISRQGMHDPSAVTSSTMTYKSETTVKQIKYIETVEPIPYFLEEDNRTQEDIECLENIMNSPLLENKVRESDITRDVRHQLNFLQNLELSPDIIFFLRKSHEGHEGASLHSNESFGGNDNPFLMTKLFRLKSVIDDFVLERQHDRYINSLPEIGRFMMHFFKECVVKVDSRHSSEEMAKQFIRAMSFINYKFSHIPEQIILDAEAKEAVARLSSSAALAFLCNYQCIQPNLPWYCNDMGFHCPYKLSLGKLKHGSPNYALRYMGYVFLCSTSEALNAFMRAPQRYCRPKPNCRIAIINSPNFRSNDLVKFFEKVFKANVFQWRDLISPTTNSLPNEIYKEAEMLVGQPAGQNKSAYEKDGSRKFNDKVGGPEENWETLSTEGKMDTLLEDAKLAMVLHKFYLLYKEKCASEIADMTIAWLQALEKNCKMYNAFAKTYSQWILVDAPVHIDFWEKLKKYGFLPDIVLILPSLQDPLNSIPGDDEMLLKKVQTRCEQIALTFPSLVEHIEEGISNLVSKMINAEETFLTVSNDGSDEELNSDLEGQFYEQSDYRYQDSQREFREVSNYLRKENISVLIHKESGPLALLEIFESYLSLFKQPAFKLDEETLKNLPQITADSYPKDPEAPSKIFTDFKSIYSLDSKYLKTGTVFEYSQQLKNYEKIKVSTVIDENEDVNQLEDEKEEVQPALDLDFLSEDNIKSMKELEILRQLPLGNTGLYCPVSLSTRHCLRLGKISFTVNYHGSHYCMSSSQALEDFAKCPFRYAFEDKRPLVPPYRIFVVGPTGPNRKNFMKILSNKLNMKPVVYSKLMAEYLDKISTNSDEVLFSEEEVFEIHGTSFLETVMKERFQSGILCEGFPNNVMQLQALLRAKLFPELVYIVDESPDEALYYAYLKRYIRWEKQLQHKFNAYLKKVKRFATKVKTSASSAELIMRVKMDSADVKMELDKIKMRIKQQEDIVYGNQYGSDSQEGKPITRNISGTSQSMYTDSSMILQNFQDDEDEESFVDDDTDEYPENPIPTALQTIRNSQSIMQVTKIEIEHDILALKQVIQILISEKVPLISIPENCTNKNCEFKFKICDYKLRKNIFEQVIIVSPNAASKLLASGQAIYSHFKNFCPVDAYQLMPINRHYSVKEQKKLYAVLYRRHLFYINGSENLTKFYTTPYGYASKTSPFFLVVPMRLLIMGPISSGVTTLCNRISNEFNFNVIGCRQFSDFLASEADGFSVPACQTASRSGFANSTSDALIEFLHFHRNDSPNGFVLDNFPICPEVLINTARANINIHLVMIIKCEFWSIWRNWRSTYLQNEPYKCISVTNQLTRLYSNFKKYHKIMKKYENFGQDLELFNIIYLKNAASKWGLWEEAKNEILISLRDIGSYYKNIRQQQVVSLSRLSIFRAEFERRLSPIKLFCPNCLKLNKRLVKYRHDFYNVGLNFYSRSCQKQFNQPFGYNNNMLYRKYDFPKLETISFERKPITSRNMFKTNLVQYGNYFYWTCDKHHIDILLNGQTLLPLDPISYPGYVAFLVTNYFRKDVVNDSFCIVTYLGQQPKQVFVLGDVNYPVFYRGKIYLCASSGSALELLENPDFYYHSKMPPYEPPYEDLDLKNFQIDYGQLTPERISEALKALAKSRPKHIALSVRDSAAVFVGLYLKTINPMSRLESTKLHEELYVKFISECSYLEWLIKHFNRKINPFIKE